jgi:hypothetical protein
MGEDVNRLCRIILQPGCRNPFKLATKPLNSATPSCGILHQPYVEDSDT